MTVRRHGLNCGEPERRMQSQRLLHWRVPEVSLVQLRDPEMTTKAQQVHWTEVPRYCDEGEGPRCLSEHDGSANIHAVKHKPHVRRPVPKRSTVICCCHDVFPAAQVIR